MQVRIRLQQPQTLLHQTLLQFPIQQLRLVMTRFDLIFHHPDPRITIGEIPQKYSEIRLIFARKYGSLAPNFWTMGGTHTILTRDYAASSIYSANTHV